MAKKCPSCQKFVNDKVEKCPFCGSNFHNQDTSAPATKPLRYAEVTNARGNRPAKINNESQPKEYSQKEHLQNQQSQKEQPVLVDQERVYENQGQMLKEPAPDPKQSYEQEKRIAPRVPHKDVWECLFCGAENNTKFCGNCGKPKDAKLDDDITTIKERNNDNVESLSPSIETKDDYNEPNINDQIPEEIPDDVQDDWDDWDNDLDEEDDGEFEELISDEDSVEKATSSNAVKKVAGFTTKLTERFGKQKDSLVTPIGVKVDKTSDPKLKQKVSSKRAKKESYDPNADHYYDDIIPAYEAELDRIPKEVIVRAIVVVVAVVATIITIAYRIA